MILIRIYKRISQLVINKDLDLGNVSGQIITVTLGVDIPWILR